MRYRYKRGRRGYRRNSTNVIKMKFQSFMDISTDVDSMKIITISAGGKNILQRCSAQFQAYKYYRLGNVSVKLVPASSLPVDPTGLAYGVDQKVDPRDQLSPGLMRITNGEDIFEDISGLDSDTQHKIYNAMMLDPRWYKWMLQRGVKRHGTPRYWQVGQLHQDKWPGAIQNIPMMHYNSVTESWSVDGTARVSGYVDDTNTPGEFVEPVNNGLSDPRGLFQTGHRGVIGWLPTDGLSVIGQGLQKPFVASPVEVEMFKIILPKAYKTRYYYRAYISETVYFKEPIVSLGFSDNGYAPLDVFHRIDKATPMIPDSEYRFNDYTDSDTGGNYGDD